MKRLLIGTAIAVALVSARPADATPILTLLPSDGAVEGAPGTTVGWGYEIANDDPLNWLIITPFNSDAFQFVTESTILDLPIVAPATTVTAPYVPGTQGLFELTWDPDAPAGFVNAGVFTIGAELWDDNPFVGGNPVSTLPEFVAAYSVSTPTAPLTPVPEPATVLLVSAGLAFAGVARRRERRRPSQRALAE